MPSLITDVIASLACFAILNALILRARASKLPLPPGIPGFPLIGNILQIPISDEPEVFRRWGEQYASGSGLIHLNIVGHSVIIINSAKVASDLLDKRSRIYSSRPPTPMLCDLMGWDWNFGLQPYGDKWRTRRRIFLQSFNPNAAQQFRPQEIKATHFLLGRLLDNPEAFIVHLRHHAAEVIMSIAYGIAIEPHDDPYVSLAEHATKPAMDAMVPGAFLVDALPCLKYIPSWMPGAGFKRKAREWKNLSLRSANEPFRAGKQMIESGEFIPSFISLALGNIDGNIHESERQEKEKLVRDAAGAMYIAGADTTVAAIASFIFAMLAAPEAQRKAQEELDRVVRPGQLPSFDNEKSLPYVTAVVWESLRWKNVAPLAVPHYLEEEDEYNGYRIPKHAIVVGNVWAILHDESLYPEPFAFKPERYLKKLNDVVQINETVKDPTFAAFGFGRRICPGRHMAYSSVWIAIASILKTFDISKAADDHGNVIEPVYKPQSPIIATPLPFKCSIKPRSKEAEELVISNARL
ncbi:cytochrome p450 [Moniliophthora roreri MCA 2997]|uniref:Cytochrome p450 n=1 Tax=Moniliophthora roreri (strain MCA 2997) TaxID=1381753 RepID=V2YC53_MONRO|nr:cytochrome p450 [Moniliophthora roreri MCA 2997]